MTSPDFHILISAKAREGTYQVRLYSVPINDPVRMASVAPVFSSHMSHWDRLSNIKPVTLDSNVLLAIGPQQIDAESELEQGNPRYASVQLDLLADPALQVIVENMRDQTKAIWCEITLFQNVLDAPTPPTGLSITWPQEEKLFFWGFIDRKSSKGKVNSQRFGKGNFIRQDSQKFNTAHNGGFSFVFFDWRTWSNFPQVKALLDGAPSGTDISAQKMMAALMANLAPTDWIYIADQQMNKASLVIGGATNPFSVTMFDGLEWGLMSIRLDPGDGTETDQLANVYIQHPGGATDTLFYYEATKQTHTLTSDQASTSLYHWNNLAQALTEWCREFFYNWQVELPTLRQAANSQLIEASGGSIGLDPRSYLGAARFLLLDISTTPTSGRPLILFVDPEEDTLEYDPCGAWASTYTVSVPGMGNILPAVASNAWSPFSGGSDESYTTLTRIRGWNNNTPATTQPTGWDLAVPNALGVLTAAAWVDDKNTGFRFTATQSVDAWGSIHAYKKIQQWGSPRAIASFTSRGVGLEPYGQSATVNGKAITAPTKTYGLRDFCDFPLGRQCQGLPGIMATPGDSSKSEAVLGFSVISIKRTPNGDTELKMIEVYSDNLGIPLTQVSTPPSPPPGPPPPPPQTGTITP